MPFLPISLAKIKTVYNSQCAQSKRLYCCGRLEGHSLFGRQIWQVLLSFKTHNFWTYQFYFHEFQRQCLQKYKKNEDIRMFITTLNWDFSVVQWSRHCSFNAGGVGSIPGQGTRSHMLCSVAKKTKTKKNSKPIYSHKKPGHTATVL